MMRNLKRFGALLLSLVLSLSLTVPAFAAVDDTGFSDVDADAWYAEAVMYCWEHNLMAGIGNNQFAPESSLTRAMLVTILWRQTGSPVVNYLIQFSDVPESQWYSEAVRWAASEQLVLGYGDGRFGTQDPITQAQLNIIMGKYTDQPITPNIPGFTGGNEPATRAQTAAVMLNLSKLPDHPTTDSGEETEVLIAYFSATNNTEGIANHLDAILDADLYEIMPELPYTAADLNYNSDCRANDEQNDPSARPAISGSVDSMEKYDVIFLGYPIWWGQAPKIISTFLESYDLSGKTIVPFCTSGSSGLGSSATNLHGLASNATWLDGQRFSGSASRSTVESWVNELDLPTQN